MMFGIKCIFSIGYFQFTMDLSDLILPKLRKIYKTFWTTHLSSSLNKIVLSASVAPHYFYKDEIKSKSGVVLKEKSLQKRLDYPIVLPWNRPGSILGSLPEWPLLVTAHNRTEPTDMGHLSPQYLYLMCALIPDSPESGKNQGCLRERQSHGSPAKISRA